MKSEVLARIKLWIEELNKIIFTPVQDIDFEYFTTFDNLGFETAEKSEGFLAAPRGLRWGEKWQYGWFRAAIVMPESVSGKRVFMIPDVGGEMLVRVNGVFAGTRDLQHEGITLTACAESGACFEILIESYAGHGPRPENCGPVRRGILGCAEAPHNIDNDNAVQVQVGRPCIGIWDEDAYQLYIDAVTLFQLYNCLDERSLRAQRLLKGLFEFTRAVDFEVSDGELGRAVRQAREILRPLLECVNGSTAPSFTVFGQSHLDLAWKWPWEETRRKCARTYANQLSLMEEYPDYIFMGCEPPILEELEKSYPQLFGRVKERVGSGNIILEGGMYVESDTNLVCGEALIRQCLYGRQYFREKFGATTRMAWLPDCFGFCAQLPQILKGCGIDFFSTQKISRAPEGCEKFPYNNFYWQGIDGTRILTHFFKKNNARYEVTELYTRWYHDREQNEDIEEMFFPFGYGDGGGGPTRDMLETVRRTRDLEGLPRTRMESPVKFFERLEASGVENVYCGEIYLPWHRGTYTAQAELKRLNRLAESALRDAELWSTASYIEDASSSHGAGREADRDGRAGLHEEIKALWKRLLFLHFHDIIPGTSMGRVNSEARDGFEAVIAQAREISSESRRRILDTLGAESGLYAWNSLSWERGGIPSVGFAGVDGRCDEANRSAIGECTAMKTEQGVVCENSRIKFVINENAEITSIVDKRSGIEFCCGRCNRFRLLKNVNTEYDAWEMASFIDSEETGAVEISLEGCNVCDGAVHVLFSGIVGNSRIRQEVFLGAGSPVIELRTTVDWHECHRLLKVDFPVAVHAGESLEESAFGYVKRPTHRSRRYEKDRFEVSQHRYTALCEDNRCFAVLNDSKYGVSTHENVISLSLLRAPKAPDRNADIGEHTFTYALYPCAESFIDSGIVNLGWELNTITEQTRYIAADRAFPKFCGGRTFFASSSKNVILEALKCAEDGSGDIVARLSHPQDCTERAALCFPDVFSHCCVADMQENPQESLDMEKSGGMQRVELEFGNFKVVTLRLKLRGDGTGSGGNA